MSMLTVSYDQPVPDYVFEDAPVFQCQACWHEAEYGSDGDACEECDDPDGVMRLVEPDDGVDERIEWVRA